jgi:hypothetical protein
MGTGSVARPKLVEFVILLLLLLALLGGCAASGETTSGGETTGGEQTSACPQTPGGETTGGETTSDEQTSACPQTPGGSQAAGGTEKQAAGPRVIRRGSDLLRPSYVGEVLGTSAFIGIAFPGSTIPAEGPDEGMEVIVFITDGDPNEMGLRGAYGEWFRGSINEEGAIDSLESDLGVEIWGPVTERTSTGAIRFEEDAIFSYRADLVSEDSNAGLYRQEDEVEGIEYTAGWIVLPDGRIRGSSFPPNIPCCGPKECLPQTGGQMIPSRAMGKALFGTSSNRFAQGGSSERCYGNP